MYYSIRQVKGKASFHRGSVSSMLENRCTYLLTLRCTYILTAMVKYLDKSVELNSNFTGPLTENWAHLIKKAPATSPLGQTKTYAYGSRFHNRTCLKLSLDPFTKGSSSWNPFSEANCHQLAFFKRFISRQLGSWLVDSNAMINVGD